MSYAIGIDIGGTFTDASAIVLESGQEFTAKTPTTPADLTEGLLTVVSLLAKEADLDTHELLGRTAKFAHGTTQTSNVIFTWDGAPTALITTQGFADELLIMRARGRVAGLSLSERRHLRATDKPPQIVPADRILEVAERVDSRGDVLVPLDEDQARESIRTVLELGVEAFAVSLLWSIKNPSHELAIERLIHEEAPEAHVSVSHRLAPVWGEYERTATTAVNAFVAPTLERYLERVSDGLADRGLAVPLLVLQANGGVVHSEQVVPINTIESGPAAGMVAARALAAATGHANVIATDVGGTTFKVGLLTDGNWTVSRNTVINQYELMLPMVDIVSIGAGGGSIAWTDGHRLRIGPRSAGADPGPACYGWGGTEPTVTDADLILGYLDPNRFLGGQLTLRPDLAESAMTDIADRLFGGDIVAAAAGVRTVVDAQMSVLVRRATIERGYDPRHFALFAYGGAGPLHAAGYARGLGIDHIVVPSDATVYSAYGAAVSDIHHTLQRSVEPTLLRDTAELEDAFKALESEARILLNAQGVDRRDQDMMRWADMRYERQLHDVYVTVPHDCDEPIAAALTTAFHRRYSELYGAAALLADATTELLRVGVEAQGRVPKPVLPELPQWPTDASVALLGQRPVYWPEEREWIDTSVYEGAQLHRGCSFAGPAVIQQSGTTITVPPGAAVNIDDHGSAVISLGKET